MKLISRGIKDTNKIARNLAQKVIKTDLCGYAVVIALEGELGAGKTTFVKGFAKTLGIKSHITSPTFVILKAYKLTGLRAYKLLIHVDAYRLKDYHELPPLGIKEIFADPRNIVLIEWAERVKPILPKKHIKIHMDHLNERARRIEITDPSQLG